jgi:hypothetical protein
MPWLEKTFTHDYDASMVTKTGESTVTCSNNAKMKIAQCEAIKMFINDLCNIFDEAAFTEYEITGDYSIKIMGINYYPVIADKFNLQMTFDGCYDYYSQYDAYYQSVPRVGDGPSMICLTKTTENNKTIYEYTIRVFYNTNYLYIQVIPGNKTATEIETYNIGFLFTFKAQLADNTNVVYISSSPNVQKTLEYGVLKVVNDLTKKFVKISDNLCEWKQNSISDDNLSANWFPDTYSRENILMLHPFNMYGNSLFIDGNIYKVYKDVIPVTNYDYFFELNGEEYYRPRGDRANSIILKL